MEFGKVFRQTNVSEKELELKSNEELFDSAAELIIIFYCTNSVILRRGVKTRAELVYRVLNKKSDKPLKPFPQFMLDVRREMLDKKLIHR